MNNNVISKLCAALIVICIALTTVATAFAVEGTNPEGSESASSVVSTESTFEATSSDEGAVTSSQPSTETPAESSGEVTTTSSDGATGVAPTPSQETTPQESSVASTQSSMASETVTSGITPTGSGSADTEDDNSSEETSSKKTSSKKTSSKKKNSSKKSNTSKEDKSSTYANNNASYLTPSYNDGSLSGDWEQEDEVELVSSEEPTKDLSDHLFDPKKAVAKWIWLPILVALACIGVLIYVNVYVYNKGAHSGSIRKIDEDIDINEDIMNEDVDYEQNTDAGDPFSVENFFNFDDDNE